jgi:acyl-CoA synthetase (AMP-forming)/AMP-acid ligase II
LLIYTSGTTADPKGVCHSSRTLLAELQTFVHMSRHRGIDEITLSPWPPGHIAGACQLLRFLVDGANMVAMDQWDAAEAALLVQQYRVTTSSGTPFHLSGLLDAAERDGRDLSSLRFYTVGAAPVPPTLIARCATRGLATFRSYGSTEHPTVSAGDPNDPLEKRLTTEGHLMPGVEIRFVDDDGSDVRPGEDGEIATRGPELFLGYFDTSINDAAFLPGGWYRTGDIGRLDEDGYLLVTDRKKDIIIRGGENISSREVEDILLSHPAIAEAAVVAAPDARLGEVVLAYVVLSPGASMSLTMVKEHFAGAGIAKQKTPERLVVLEVMPRNATGKILKHVLRRGG